MAANPHQFEDPEIMKKLEQLKNGRDEMNPVERGEIEKALVNAGMSKREIGRRIGRSEGAVRRDINIMELPEAQRSEVAGGKAVKPILDEVRKQHREESWQNCKADETDRARCVRRAADAVFTVVMEVSPSHRELLLYDAERRADYQQAANAKFPQDFALPDPASPDDDPLKVLRSCFKTEMPSECVTLPVRPPAEASRPQKPVPASTFGDRLWLDVLIQELATGLLKIAPDFGLRNEVTRAVKSRLLPAK